jgi:glycine betaine catabolism A
MEADVIVKPREMMPAGATTLPAAYYTDPAYYQREMDALFLNAWICAGRVEQVARSGQYILRDVLGESVIITSNGSGQVNAFYNVCRHRGTKLCVEHEGTFGRSIQCPYHAWTYDLDGRLIGAPHMDEVPHFDKADYPL